MSIHFSVDIYLIFDVDTVHVLSPSVSKFLNECPVWMLNDDSLTTTALRTELRSSDTLEVVDSFILQ